MEKKYWVTRFLEGGSVITINQINYLVLVGTSTGGPRALQTLLENLPFRTDTALLVVQHMPEGFTRSLAKRLNSLSAYMVKEGEDGEPISGGTAYIAPGGQHMVIKRKGKALSIGLNTDPPRKGHRPAVDVLLESAQLVEKEKLIFCIMTGMGRDGSQGLKTLKETHHVYTVAQDEASSVVYGMPKAVVEAGLADRIVPIEQMAEAIIEGIKKIGG